MDALSNETLMVVWVVAGALTVAAVVLFLRSKHLKSKCETVEAELAERSAEELVEALYAQNGELKEKIAYGRQMLGKLTDAHLKAQTKVEKIKAGLPPPNFKVDDDEDLKAAINQIRDKQYRLIENNEATTSLTEWSWFGSKSDGKILIKTYNKLMIGAFNAEVDLARSKMRHGSYDTAINKLEKSVKALEKLAETVNVLISPRYLQAKEEELQIWHSDLVRRQEAKEQRKRERALLRQQNQELGRGSDDDDEEELGNELDACEKDLAKAREMALQIAGDDLAEMELKIAEIEEERRRLEEKFQRSISQAQITRAGYLYVISNVGSFGEDICKIGMTRRLEPMDRVVELGDASVPYRFDVHTLAFVQDAPKLEKQIHTVLTEKRVNRENHRKEFFYVTPAEAKGVMEEMGIKSSWYFEREAREYRESELRREAMKQARRAPKTALQELPESI
ncbi:DUF4041 domain-containing protein [Marinobacter sp.]|uniref:DUF4041 domain-containing protein n=1 Tax=Marinobacter sp. TaxID=50741 RepID=UPI003564EF94